MSPDTIGCRQFSPDFQRLGIKIFERAPNFEKSYGSQVYQGTFLYSFFNFIFQFYSPQQI